MDNELQKFIESQNKHIRSLYPNLDDTEKYVYAQSVKLSEEMGELSEAVLAHFQTQRKSKRDKDIWLEKEFADVIITTLLLAKSMGVDTNQALRERVALLQSRRKTD